MRIERHFLVALAATTALACGPRPACQSFYRQFRSHNASMAELQPSWMGPLIQSDARLAQALRLSVSDANAPGAQIINYGNNHGFSVIAERRFQFEIDPPPFFRNHSSASPDGFGNAGAQIKVRIASGNAEHGNFAVTAIDFHGFAPRAGQNGILTAYDCPKIAAGIARGRFNAQSTLSGVLPSSKVTAQGRVIEWNFTGQMHPTEHTWFDFENNAAFNLGGPVNGKMQNFITPAAFYMLRRKQWEPTHAALVFDAGMQIATSSFHLYNHNLLAEMRILF